MSDDQIELLCKHCGATFSAFLHQMEAQNAKVVCPCCGKAQEHSHPATAVKAPARPN